MTGRYAAPSRELTPRELAVLMLVADAWTNPAISARLGIAMHTTETHLRHIYDKMLGDDFDDRKNARVAAAVMYWRTVAAW